MASSLQYTVLPDRAKKAIEGFLPNEEAIAKRTEDFGDVKPRQEDQDGDTETLDDALFTHHFTKTPGDYEEVQWHYVTCGQENGTPIVFLHGIPASKHWHHQMAVLSATHFCVAIDLKGYGQSEKSLVLLPPKQCYLVTHDRGTLQADFICASHPDAVLGYARGEQHLYHFDPVLAPQHEIFTMAPYTGVMEDRKKFVIFVYTWITQKPVPRTEMERVVQEFCYPGINSRRGWKDANGATSKQGLLKAWECPVVIMQGYDSKTQPREFYQEAREYIPNAAAVEIRYLSGGYFWTLESPEETTVAVKRLIELAEGK
ncbi:hypothetical protein LTR37_000631 [Vermiconidia calcicola]|uniref:Uncharacterized protein n=1 Tax=Vermiconidia calcicola TaxID=1690605 RepID=A0ACC3NY10_9PEZI|nr:hypothetical protein LTR37_000631 [Vermiconidia calcicola]